MEMELLRNWQAATSWTFCQYPPPHPLPFAHRSLYIQNIVFAYIRSPCNSVLQEEKKRRREVGKKRKNRAAATCLLRDAVVSALVICPFVTDVPTEGAIIFAYMHTKIFALSTTPTLAGVYTSFHMTVNTRVGEFYRFSNICTLADLRIIRKIV